MLSKIAKAMASSSLIPETLRTSKGSPLPPEVVEANCFLVTEQAARWELSPFAVLSCASVVHGRLMWEGKLVAAVIEVKTGVRLSYKYSGSGEDRKVVVSGTLPGDAEPHTIEGTAGQWKTTGAGSPWGDARNYDRQLAYRGAREWGRRHAPATMLGVYTPDEAVELEPRIRDVTLPKSNPFGEKPVANIEAKEPPEAEPAESPPLIDVETVGAVRATITGYNRREGVTRGKPWICHDVTLEVGDEEITASTFSGSLAEKAIALMDGPALVEFVPGKKSGFFELLSVEEVGA